MNKMIHPVILCGGSGSRLWPLSRKAYPKQFSRLLGNNTLFQQSALRLVSSDLITCEPHIILTNTDFRFIVLEQLKKVGLKETHILIEPEAKNTGPAILAASLFAISKNSEAKRIALSRKADFRLVYSVMFSVKTYSWQENFT